LNIALDFDETYTRDPDMWNVFIADAKGRGHDVRIVTFRHYYMTDPALDYLASSIPVIFTGYQQKRTYCKNFGWLPDIWIDDSPEFIVEHHQI